MKKRHTIRMTGYGVSFLLVLCGVLGIFGCQASEKIAPIPDITDSVDVDTAVPTEIEDTITVQWMMEPDSFAYIDGVIHTTEYIVLGGKHGIRLVDAHTGISLDAQSTDTIYSLVSDGVWIASGTREHRISLWQVQDGSLQPSGFIDVASVLGDDIYTDIALGSDRVAVASGEQGVLIYDLRGELQAEIGIGAIDVVKIFDGGLFYAGGQTVYLASLEQPSNIQRYTLPIQGHILDISVSERYIALAMGMQGCAVLERDLATNTIQSMRMTDSQCLAVEIEGNRLFSADGKRVEMWNIGGTLQRLGSEISSSAVVAIDAREHRLLMVDWSSPMLTSVQSPEDIDAQPDLVVNSALYYSSGESYAQTLWLRNYGTDTLIVDVDAPINTLIDAHSISIEAHQEYPLSIQPSADSWQIQEIMLTSNDVDAPFQQITLGQSEAATDSTHVDFALPILQYTQNSLRLLDMRGKILVLVWWNSTHPLAMWDLYFAENISRLYAEGDVAVVLANHGELRSTIEQYLQQSHVSLPCLMDQQGVVYQQYPNVIEGFATYPLYVVIDQYGVIRYIHRHWDGYLLKKSIDAIR